MVILLFAFGTATAMVAADRHRDPRPRRSTLVAHPLLGHATDVPTVAPTLATMIGLGVGIDYALFIVTRHKLQLGRGHGDARVDRARHARPPGGAVVFAGFTVVIALVLAGRRRHPARHDARLHGGDRRRRRGARRASRCCRRCSARSARASTRCASSSAAPIPTTSSRTAGRAMGARRRRGGRGRPDRERRPAPRARAPGAPAPARPDRHERAAEVDHRAAGLRPDHGTGFGPGTNGPLLIAVKLDSPATGDPTKDPRLHRPPERRRQDPRRAVGRAGHRRQGRGRPRSSPRSRPRRRLPTRPRTWSNNLRDTSIPKAVAGHRHDRLRRRPDRRLHRPRRRRSRTSCR